MTPRPARSDGMCDATSFQGKHAISLQEESPSLSWNSESSEGIQSLMQV